ncbi:hypothetical protein BJV77DRAFT_1041180, partial [Russula vinacea]
RPYELSIARRFSSKELAGDRRNHCAALLDVIELEGPGLIDLWNVAHRDCTANNIMLDPSRMYPYGFHPVKIDRKRNFNGKATAYTRTQRPSRYLLIDFGLSRQYTSRDAVDDPLRGGDKSAPEHKSQRQSNPDRPRIEDVIRRFAIIRKTLSKTKLRSALTSKRLPRMICATQEARQHVRTIHYILSGKASIPDP